MALQVRPVDCFVVRENQGEQQHEVIGQAVKFSSAYLSRETVCFRLTFTVDGGEYNKTVIYLQITPHHLDSLCLETCKLKDRGLPHLDDVRRRLGRKGGRGGRGDLTCFRFQLRSGTHVQRIVPADFPAYEALDGPARHALDIVASVAASPSFSLYTPANQLSRRLLDACVEAVERRSVLTEKEQHSYQRAVQLQRLYGGKGGKVLAVGDDDFAVVDHDSSSRPETDSCSTLAFDVVPRHNDSPPQYGECPPNVEKLMAMLPGAAKVVESSLVDCSPPEYGDIEQPRDSPVASKRVRQCEDEDGLPHPSSKRVLLRGLFAAISAPASVTNARRFEAKAKSELDDADVDGNKLLRDLMRRVNEQENRQLLQEQENYQLRHEIKLLQENVKRLQGQNTNYEKRHSEVEEIAAGLEHQQDLVKDELENFDVQIGELEGKLGELEKQMPYILDEWEDLMRDTIRDTLQEDTLQDLIADLVKEHAGDLFSDYMDREGEGNLAGPLRAYVRKIVADQIATTRAKIRKALRG